MREMNMRYWILTTEFPPQFGGGIATYARNTARMLQQQQHEVTVFISDNGLHGEKIELYHGIRVIRFSPDQTRAREFLGYNARVSYEYAAIVKKYLALEGAPDILESQEYHAIAYYVQQFKSLGYEGFRDLTILITCHAPSFLCLEYNQVPIYQFPQYWTGEMEKSGIRQADILISPSRYFAGEARKRMHWEDLTIHYLVNPLLLEEQREQPVETDHTIVCFGKLSPLKGSFEMLVYFARLWEEGFDYPLHIIGSGQQIFHPEGRTMGDLLKEKYEKFIRQELLVFEGDMSPEQARDRIRKARLVIVPSIFDNLPYTVLEAMSWGKVVLASRQGGQSEVITDGVNGFLFDHEIWGDFETRLPLILNKPEAILQRIGENAAKYISENFSYEKVYREKMEIIRQYLAKPKDNRHFQFINPLHPAEKPLVRAAGKKKGLLSVVIPYYNMGEFVHETVASVLNSDYNNIEVIIINDGSNDPFSLGVLTNLEENFPVRVIHKKNEGLPLTRNFGAWQAHGEYLAFLDADDTIDPSYYSKAIRVLEAKDNVFFVGCWTQYTGLSKGTWPTFNPEPPYLLVHNMINSSALVYKTDAFRNAGLNHRDMTFGMEDWESVISLVEHNYRGVVLPETLFNYRVRKNSMSRSFTRVKQLHLNRLIGEKHRPLFDRFGFEIAQILHANGSGLQFDNPSIEQNEPVGLGMFQVSGRMKEQIKLIVRKNRYTRQLAYNIYKHLKK